jgi:hypothetical protein
MQERILFLDFPEATTDIQMYSAMYARAQGFPLSAIRKALEKFSLFLFNRKPPSKERWYGYRTFVLDISQESRSRVSSKKEKYSGWRRHHNDHGSLGPTKLDPFPLEPNIDEYELLKTFLSIVENITIGQSAVIINNLKVII